MKRKFYLFPTSYLVAFTLLFLILSAVSNAQPYTLFSPGGVPAQVDADDNPPEGGIVVGFKFKVTQAGTLSAIRFYKGAGSGTGPFTVSLWTNGTPGTLVTSATSAVGAGAGWAEIDITDQTLIPNTVYVISSFNPDGIYCYTNNDLPVTPDQRIAPFIIISSANDPAGVGNCVYKYTAANDFPDLYSGNAPNYFVDPVFTPFFPLPVTLVDLKATSAQSNITLSWKTVSELNNAGFVIERSNNGADWYSIGFVQGAGNSGIEKAYSFVDRTLAPGLYYYRLQQKDIDGKTKASPVVTASVGGKGQVSLAQNYPNPFYGSTLVKFDLPTTQKVKLSIVDLAGREVKVLVNKVAEAGTHQVTLSSDGLSRQTYIIRLQTENTTVTKTMLVQ